MTNKNTLRTLSDQTDYKNQVVAAVSSNGYIFLEDEIDTLNQITLLHKTSTFGWKMIRNSLAYLFIKAVKELFNKDVEIRHTLNKGLYCEIKDYEIKEDIQLLIKEKIKEYISNGFFIERLSSDEYDSYKVNNYSTKEAVENNFVFAYKMEVQGVDSYSVNFLHPLVQNSIDLLDVKDCFHIGTIESKGFVLLPPQRLDQSQVTEFAECKNLITAFEDVKDWADKMKIDSISELNEMILAGKSKDIIQLSEAMHENKIAKIADDILRKKGIRVILIAGPSSSGKTSFSKRLALQLKANGLNPMTLSTDDYFVDRDLTPIDEFGNKNYETIEALDLELFNNDLSKILRGTNVEIPTFNFKEGKKEYNGHYVQLDPKQPIIIEGIHSLNPRLTSQIFEAVKYRIYVSPLTHVNLDDHNRVGSTLLRLIRRSVRDSQFRGYPITTTLDMWESVRRGEQNYIYPYQHTANVVFNTSLPYELSVLKKYIIPLLEDVEKMEDRELDLECEKIKALMSFIEGIDEEDDIPKTSIVREFIGNSSLF